MTSWLVGLPGILLLLVVAPVLVLTAWRALDRQSDESAWQQLLATQAANPPVYRSAMTTMLPEPARRYFAFTISEGAPLYTVAEIDMRGELGLGSRDSPAYRPMLARQILAPPQGLVWRLRSGPIAGSDGALAERSWTRFWLFGLLPVVRAGGPDHRRSAFGRVIAESAFWVPASLLPGDSVRWEPLGADSARAVVTHGGLEQAVDITVDEAGAPIRVLIQRWSNANRDKVYREQPFGGELSAFRDFDGYRLPTCVEGGNLIGTPDYYPFFKAQVTAIRFPSPRAP